MKLLDDSLRGKEFGNIFWKHIVCVFGDLADTLIAQFDKPLYSHYIKSTNQKEVKKNYYAMFNDLFSMLKNNEMLIDRFGKCAIKDFDICFEEGTSYGEWWDRDLINSGKDKLILFKNENVINQDDMFYTIIHETYPGHGHFYNRIRNSEKKFDQGAILLIEGWATFCEWNTFLSPYIDIIRHNALAFLYDSFHLTPNELADKMWANKKENNVSESRIIASVVNATQYIGFIESYYFGVLWFEHMIKIEKKYTPAGILEKIQKENKGDFFQLWQ